MNKRLHEMLAGYVDGELSAADKAEFENDGSETEYSGYPNYATWNVALWYEWWRCVAQLRPACTRAISFMWMAVVLLGFSIRSELAGVTSIVRAGWLRPEAYRRLLRLFGGRN